MRRRDLLKKLPLALLAIPVLGPALGCVSGDDDDYPLRPNGNSSGNGGNGQGTGGSNDASFVAHNEDQSGHAHDLELLCADLDGGVTVYTATGPHQHRVELRDADLSNILNGQRVEVVTTGGGHEHTWVIAMPTSRC